MGLPNGRPIFMVIFRGTNIPPTPVKRERNHSRRLVFTVFVVFIKLLI